MQNWCLKSIIILSGSEVGRLILLIYFYLDELDLIPDYHIYSNNKNNFHPIEKIYIPCAWKYF